VAAQAQQREKLETALSQAHGEETRVALLQRAVACIASHHRAGLEQRDIHLNNFLLSGEHLYTLDGGGIRDSGSADLPVALIEARFGPVRARKLVTEL
jgi:tRNA A-37 threonylcarbamoyl transferase component Bud32